MKLPLKFAAFLLCTATFLSAQSIPVGTVLPVTLSSTLDTRKDKPGEKIEGKLMQDVPLPDGAKMKRGSHVVGHVVQTTRTANGFRMALKFDQLEDGGTVIPLNVSVRAIADSDNIFNAHLPINAASSSESSDEWVTKQVGGDIVNRGRGLVASGDSLAGHWKGAVWATLAQVYGCPPQTMPQGEQAMWVFSVNACGVYGFRDVKIARAGDSDPVGQVVLESLQDLHIGDGSGWLLIANGAPSAGK